MSDLSDLGGDEPPGELPPLITDAGLFGDEPIVIGIDPAPGQDQTVSVEPEQMMLLDLEVPWRAAWKGMPEFVQEDLKPLKSILVHFETDEDMVQFAKLIDQTITPNTRSLWFPEAEIGRMTDKRYANDPDL